MSRGRRRREEPIDRRLAVARIGIGLAALLKAAIVIPEVLSLTWPGALRLPLVPWIPAVPSLVLPVVATLWLVSGVAFVMGWRPRWTGSVLALSLLTILLGDQQLYSNHLYLLVTVLVLVLLALGGAGWATSLLRLQVSIVYGFAALAKVNLLYLSGSVLAAYLGSGEALVPFPASLRTFAVLAPLAWISIGTEAFLAAAIWSTRWRPAAFAVGFLFHFGILLGVGPTDDLFVFALIMFSLYLLHVDAPEESRLVIWDDHCGFCGTWVRWFRRFDWLNAHRYVGSSTLADLPAGITRAEASEAIQLVSPEGRAAGFSAVGRILEVLPVSFLWAPFFRIGWIRRVGDRAYRRVAARRSCPVPS